MWGKGKGEKMGVRISEFTRRLMEGWKVRDGKWRGINERKLAQGREKTKRG